MFKRNNVAASTSENECISRLNPCCCQRTQREQIAVILIISTWINHIVKEMCINFRNKRVGRLTGAARNPR